jgi:glycosyltransferase involved in cell wall biosynthesis
VRGTADDDAMSDVPLVSGITPFLNAATFLEEAIASVLRQTYDRWELLLVDDGSTDRSSAIARRYAEDHPTRIRYLEHPHHMNRGMSASRNLGIAAATGEYIAFLDSDDVWWPRKLEHQVRILGAHPEAAMVYGPTLLWYGWTGKPEDATRDTSRRLGVPPEVVVAPPNLFELYLRGIAQTPGTCGALLRRTAIDDVGGFDDAFTGLYEDQVFFYKIALKWPVFVTSVCSDSYRQHPDSCCAIAERAGHLSWDRPHAAERALLDWLVRHLMAQKVTDPRLWQALERRFWPYRHPVLHEIRRTWQKAVATVRSGRPSRSAPTPSNAGHNATPS